MTRDELIAMAREADLIDFRDANDDPHTEQMVEFLERFAALVAAKEREACAQVCDEQHDRARATPGAVRAMACAERIRARSAA